MIWTTYDILTLLIWVIFDLRFLTNAMAGKWRYISPSRSSSARTSSRNSAFIFKSETAARPSGVSPTISWLDKSKVRFPFIDTRIKERNNHVGLGIDGPKDLAP